MDWMNLYLHIKCGCIPHGVTTETLSWLCEPATSGSVQGGTHYKLDAACAHGKCWIGCCAVTASHVEVGHKTISLSMHLGLTNK